MKRAAPKNPIRGLMRQAAEKVQELGSATVDDLMPFFPLAHRKQLFTALQNARDVGWIRVKVKGTQGSQGKPSVWEPGKQEKQDKPVKPVQPIPSVFHLATVEDWKGAWPPLTNAGRRYAPLGDWQ
jgi:hypothetical protein